MAALEEKRAAMLRQVEQDIAVLHKMPDEMYEEVSREDFGRIIRSVAGAYFDEWNEGPDGWKADHFERVLTQVMGQESEIDEEAIGPYLFALVLYISYLKEQGRIRNDKALKTRIAAAIEKVAAWDDDDDYDDDDEDLLDSEEEGVTRECFAELYGLAEELRLLEPWKAFKEREFITILIPGLDEPLYVSFWRNDAPMYGINVYPGYDSFIRWQNYLNAKDKYNKHYAQHEMRALTVFYGNSTDVNPVDREIMKELGLHFRGKNRWVYFRLLSPSRIPDLPNGVQADIMREALANAIMAVKARVQIPYPMKKGETYLRFYDEEQSLWNNVIAEALPVQALVTTYKVRNEILIKQLKRRPMNAALCIEADVFYLEAPVRDDQGGSPFLPRLVTLIDQNTGIIMQQFMADPEASIVEVLAYLLDQMITDHSRPREIVVRNQKNYDYLEDFAKRLNIQLTIGTLKQTNRFIREISSTNL